MAQNVHLSLKQARFVRALLEGNSRMQAAVVAGVSPRQSTRWLSDPRVRHALAVAVGEALAELSARVAQGAGEGLSVLLGLLSDPAATPAVRRAAARDLLDTALRYSEAMNLEERIAALENRMEAQDERQR